MTTLRTSLSRIRNALAYVAGRQPMERTYRDRDDDNYLVSYPKSGNTWVRFLVANLLWAQRGPVGFDNIEQIIPDPDLHFESMLGRLSSPRCFKSHSAFNARYPRALVIVRDPRDVAASYFRYQKKVEHPSANGSIDRFVDLFVNGEIDRYGPWHLHTGSWLIACMNCPEKFRLVRYEELSDNCEHSLTMIAKFLGIDACQATIETAVEMCSANQMRRNEKLHGEKWKPIRGTRKDIAFVGTAKPNVWTEALPDSASKRIELAFGDVMKQLGYSFED